MRWLGLPRLERLERVRILADENIPRSVVDRLRADGHDVHWAAETSRRAPDIQHVATAIADDRVLLTEDADFARLVIDGGAAAPALVLVRLHGMSRKARTERIARAFEQIPSQPAPGSIHVVEHSRVRKRLP
jgi:predicted nuclease of predicted toxin-antitoxin system